MRVKSFLTDEVLNLVFAAAKDGPYSQIVINFSKQHAYATDKTILAKCRIAIPPAYALYEPIAIPLDAVKMLRDLEGSIDIGLDKGLLTVYKSGTILKTFELQKPAADLDKMYPESVDEETEYKININPTLLTTLIKSLGLKKTEGLAFCVNKKDSQSSVRLVRNGKTLGMIMPMRNS